MNPKYRETFRRHRTIFLVPVVLAFLFAAWSTVTAPKAYRASATLWSDSAGTPAFGAPPPAQQEQTMLNELLTTQRFLTSVAQRSPLADYLQSHSSSGSGPGALMAKLSGPKPLNDQIVMALGPKKLMTIAKGPHVLEVDFDAPTPVLASKTLNVVLDQFLEERKALRNDALTGYKTQVEGASAALVKAQETLSNYAREHPGVTNKDPQLRELVHSEQAALTQLHSASEVFNEQSDALLSAGSGQPTVVVLDKPKPPTAPTAGKKHIVMGLFAGLFAGILISALGVVLVTKARPEPAPDTAGTVVSHAEAAPTENGSIPEGVGDRRALLE
jgi:uncharacterized protein involved in exopolysaccharide biosynthesis